MARKRPASPDALGRRGEKRFADICSYVPNWVVNKALDHDAAGWDYIIDFPLPGGATLPLSMPLQSLDTQPAPISCRVQVKSIWNDRDEVAVSLSVLARLAKSPDPTFIYVLKFDENLEPTSGHLIHLLDDNLASVLKRLRQEEKRKNSKLNKVTLTFSPSRAGRPLPTRGDALRTAILDIVGGERGYAQYADLKRHQLNTLGYDANSHKGSVSFNVKLEELIDASLSLRPIETKTFQMTTTRFGISLPMFARPLKNAMLSISPTQPMRCKLVARRSAAAPIVVDVEFRAPAIPGLPSEHSKMLIIAPTFQMILKDGRISFQTTLRDNESLTLPTEEWVKHFEFCVTGATEGLDLELIETTKGAIDLAKVRPHSLEGDVDALKFGLQAVKMADEIAKMTGGIFPPVSLPDIFAAATEMSQCLALRHGEKGTLSGLINDPLGLPTAPLSMNFVYAFPIGSAIVAYSVSGRATVAKPNPKDVKLTLRLANFGLARTLRSLETEFKTFCESVERRNSITATISKVSPRLPLDGTTDQSPQPPMAA